MSDELVGIVAAEDGEHRWLAANLSSGELAAIGMNDTFAEGPTSFVSAVGSAQMEPAPGSHVALARGEVQCVGFEDEAPGATGGAFYCWDSRLPAGEQIVNVSGMTFDHAYARTWADRYLVAVGHSGDEDYELFWADLAVPSPTPMFRKLFDNVDGSSFHSDGSSVPRSVQVLSDDVMCWLADAGRGVDGAPANDRLHCHVISANKTLVVSEENGRSVFELSAALVGGSVYAASGPRNEVWAWNLISGNVSRLQDDVQSQGVGFQVDDIYYLSEYAGVAFSYYD